MFAIEAGLLAVEAITGAPPEPKKKGEGGSILSLAMAMGATPVKGGADVPYGW